ncbi:4-(cytidine 5'-diphospho)-2-C-methyl-D-erythritol kinase [Neisseriaceae bacterium TC5R-5]|nr:4-(cytidine 5'-diphospho)-2-C-methyl-D-erythritol kinase [Neisseriaceae bacterium TC5R-5]
MSLAFQAFPAPAKLNLLLHIVGKRSDGYHLLETVFRFISLYDTVHLAVREDAQIILETPTPGVESTQDLTVRAAKLLQAYTQCKLGVSIRLDKKIPMGGGLGGGSSDAATVLLALNQLWQLHLPRQELQALGVQLGADVPVFIFGRNAFATGIGEKLSAIELPPAWYVIVHPQVHISTAKIFQKLKKTVLTELGVVGIMRILKTRQQRSNDLQSLVLGAYPQVSNALNELKKYGSPLMTGSGSCIFLELDSENEAKKIYNLLLDKYCVFLAQGLSSHPISS